MRRVSAGSEPVPSPEYSEKQNRLLQELRDCEKKRLSLEKKLYEYRQSAKYRAKLQYVKLKKNLEEIRESEKKAHIRNKEYLQQCEHLQAHIAHSVTHIEKLQELKVAVQAGFNSETALSRELYQPETIFMDRQMTAIPSLGDFRAVQKSPQPTKNFSLPDPQQTAQSRNVTDSYVVQTNSDTQCLNKYDKIDGKTSLQTGEKTLVTASILSEEQQTHCLEIGSNTRHGKSNLSEGKKSAELHSLLQKRLSPENRTTDLKCDSSSRSEGSEREILTQELIEVKEERARPPVSSISVSEYCASENKCSQEKHSAGEDFSGHFPHGHAKSQKPFRKVQEVQEEESWSSSSDLTVSVSEDDLILKSPEPQPNPSGKMEGEDGAETLKLIDSEQEGDAPSDEKHNCVLKTVSSPESKKESSTNSPTRELMQFSRPQRILQLVSRWTPSWLCKDGGGDGVAQVVQQCQRASTVCEQPIYFIQRPERLIPLEKCLFFQTEKEN